MEEKQAWWTQNWICNINDKQLVPLAPTDNDEGEEQIGSDDDDNDEKKEEKSGKKKIYLEGI